jgi:hypothetical protein
MEDNCKNCGTLITANFCSNCGQKKYKRIDKKYLIDELQYTVLHTNKGLLHTLKKLIKNPGKTAREFVDGNRVNHYKPILLVFLLSTISAFVMYKVIGMGELMDRFYIESKTPFASQQKNLMTWMSNYIPFIMLLGIPFFALITKIAFRKWGHNYYEHFVMNAFFLSLYTTFNIIIIYPITYFLKNNALLFMILSNVLMHIGSIILLIWFFRGFYQEKDKTYTTLRALLSYGIFLVLYVGISIIGVIIGIIYLISTGADLQQFAQ